MEYSGDFHYMYTEVSQQVTKNLEIFPGPFGVRPIKQDYNNHCVNNSMGFQFEHTFLTRPNSIAKFLKRIQDRIDC